MKTLRASFIMVVGLLCATIAYAQPDYSSGEYDKVSIGLGLGFDYGGIGANLLAYPQKNIGLFFGAGYAFAGVGYNGGMKFRFATKSRVHPYLIGMYGYNAAISVSNYTNYNKFFYGPTFGFGIDMHSRRSGYWSLALMVPVRGSEVDNYINSLKASGVSFSNSLSPVGFSIGYHFYTN